MFASGGMGAVVWHPLCYCCEWPSSHQRLQVDFRSYSLCRVNSLNTLLVVTAAVLVEVGAAIRGAARLVSATAAAHHGCWRNFGARGLFGNGREL